VAWVEGWFDAAGRFHSQVMVADLTNTIRRHALSAGNELAAGLSFAADPAGGQALAWKACGGSGDCQLRDSLRPANGHFSAVQRLGSIDASESPAVTVSPAGQALLGWIRDGHVLAAQARSGAHRFGSTRTVSATTFATDLSLAFGPSGQALAAWTQGTLAQAVMGAVYSAR
jgi:hypothetical protein